jgi:hypothetical protein
MAYWGGQGYRPGPTIVPNVRRHVLVWRQFRKASGVWPTLSIVSFVMRFVIGIAGGILCSVYADRHDLTKVQGELVGFAFLLAVFIAWFVVVELSVWNYDLRRAGLSSRRETWNVDQFPPK